MIRSFRGISFGVLALLSVAAQAEIKKVRLTSFANPKDLGGLFTAVNAALGTSFKNTDFALGENVPLKGMTFLHLVQVKGQQPIEGAALRLWLGADGSMIVAEGYLDKPTNKNAYGAIRESLKRYLKADYLKNAMELHQQEQLVRSSMVGHPDAVEMNYIYNDLWKGQDFQRVFRAQGKRGTHEVRYSHGDKKIVSHTYKEFFSAELAPIPAMGYKIFEQGDGENQEIMQPELISLKYLNDKAVGQTADPYAKVTGQPYSLMKNAEMLTQMLGISLGATWSFADLQKTVDAQKAAIVSTGNGLSAPNGLILDGRFVNVTVNSALKQTLGAKGADFPWVFSDYLDTKRTVADGAPAVQLDTNFRGQAIKTQAQLLEAPTREPLNSLSALFKNHTDEVQVYYAVTEMMDQLQKLGFTDPELSTRKFTAILYNPDPSFANNAYYVADTLNFTTYSAKRPNFARDNTTIWHELGHGIVDRLMGPVINVTKAGGFHEGVADFFAELLVQATSFQRDFPGRVEQRIYNQTPFNMTNESHDDGEAFGGFMKTVLDEAIEKWGKNGVAKTADLLLDSMRFSRNHPAFDEREWVEKLRFSDTRASSVRAAGEFNALITKALAGRNFADSNAELADLKVALKDSTGKERVIGFDMTSISNVTIVPAGVDTTVEVKINLVDGANYKFKYPIRIEIGPTGGAAGPIDWVDEDLGKKLITVTGPGEIVVPMGLKGVCDRLNSSGTGCGEPLMIEVFQGDEKRAFARKRALVLMDVPRPSILGLLR